MSCCPALDTFPAPAVPTQAEPIQFLDLQMDLDGHKVYWQLATENWPLL
jgi:hypothetical protein